ncbi:MAG: DUF424 family protein [Candidatus Diapherotrites archaeon]|nr:DUF424 family protein [Candidatus Diapherotrites archaeon]
MFAKIHEIEYKTILAVCDKEYIGKTFEEGNICFTASERFYKGEEVTKDELEKMLTENNSANLFGNKCVSIALEKGLVGEKSIIVIKGIKHAQIYRL